MPKILLSVLDSWSITGNTGNRYGILANGKKLSLLLSSFGPSHRSDMYYWTIDSGDLYHRENSTTFAAAQDAADCYLAEHFELPVSVEDELAAAKKRIAELELRIQALPYRLKGLDFQPGQPVHIKGASKAATIPITCVRLYQGETIYSLANGMSFKAHELEPAN